MVFRFLCLAAAVATCEAYVVSSVHSRRAAPLAAVQPRMLEAPPPAGFVWATLDGDETPAAEPAAAAVVEEPVAAAAVEEPAAPSLSTGPSYARPECVALPGKLASVDEITTEMLRSFSAGDLDAAIANLEVAIFDSPPFGKVNESDRRRNLALGMFLKEDPALYPAIIPNAKEVLRQVKGEDAEMQLVLGVSMLGCMEGSSSQSFARRCLEQALKLQPDYPEAQAALAKA